MMSEAYGEPTHFVSENDCMGVNYGANWLKTHAQYISLNYEKYNEVFYLNCQDNLPIYFHFSTVTGFRQ